MRVFVCALAILVVAVCVPCQADEAFKNAKKECKKEAGITDELKKGEKPNFEDPKVKCFVTCVGKKLGTIVDGKVNAEEAIKKLSKRKELDDTQKEAVKGCAETANQQSDCEVGATFMKCIHEKKLFKGKKDEAE